MTQDLLDIEDDIDSDDSDVGKRYLFWRSDRPDEETFSFSSTLENIGVLEKHDCSLKNKTEVLVLGDPTDANHLTLGPILVSRALAHKCMWLPTNCLVPIEMK